ncbi:MAG: FAD-dependent oxidoreductase [Rhodoferax sp.]|nr:FAD-dependent oxidoreductase [Rhodoferax sp.]
MKIAVVGAGIVGIATAHALAEDGHTVVVLEKSGAACEETSFATGGLVAPSLTLPFSLPSKHRHAMQRTWESGQQLSRNPWMSTQQLGALWRFSKHKTDHVTAEAEARQLAQFSNDTLQQLLEHYQLDIERSEGQLLLFATQEAWDGYQPQVEQLKSIGVACRAMTSAECRTIEPALQEGAPILAGLSLPGDSVVNCRQFALTLKTLSQKRGVDYRFNAPVVGLEAGPKPVLRIALSTGTVTEAFDHVVLCTAQWERSIATQVLPDLPSLAIHGYTLSVTLKEPLNGPRSAIQEHASGLVLHRMGQRIRVYAGAEVGPRPAAHDMKVVNRLYQALETYFPGATNYKASKQVWQGTRHCLADGLPAVGPSRVTGVSLNLGHGANGWGWACGTAQILADQLAGRDGLMSSTPFLPSRFSA